jgi:peptidoglycan/LPS O-acetylase OafA/YrhL
MTAQKTNSRLQILDALRGLAAIGVALVHFTVEMKPTIFQQLCHWGWVGVDVFFVISGFIIPYSLAKSGYVFRKDYGRFLLKRAIRLHPPYLAVVLILVLLGWYSATALGTPAPSLRTMAGEVALHASLLNGLLGRAWLSPVFWTLAIEFQFYLVAGLVTPMLLAKSSAIRYSVLVAILVASLSPISKDWVLPHLPLFVIGILAFLYDRKSITVPVFLAGVATAAVICAVSMGKPQALVAAFTALTIAFYRFPIPKWAIKLGALSYSLYLLHPLVGGYVIQQFHPGTLGTLWAQLLAVIVAMAVSAAAAWAFVRLVEAPSQRASSAIRYRGSERL